MKDIRRVVGLVALAMVVGCGSDAESTVSGSVTMDGTLLDHGSVTFYPSDTSIGRTASGSIRSDGTYTVQSAQTGGLPSGEYDVAVISNKPSKPSRHGGPPTPGKLITPKKYKDPENSGFHFQLAPGSNEIDLELTTK